MEQVINEKLIISEIEIVEERISDLIKGNVDVQTMVNFINKEENTIFYFDQLLNMREQDDKDVWYAWLDSGYIYNGEPIFISLMRYNDIFCGYFIGTAKFLVNGLCERNSYRSTDYRNNIKKFQQKYVKKIENRKQRFIEIEKKIKDDVVPVQQVEIHQTTELTSVTNEIYDHLLFTNWHSINGLDRYIKLIGCRIVQFVKQGKEEYFVKNNIGSVIVNSGLIDMFGKDYLIMYRINMKENSYVAYKLIESKKDYIENNFTKEQASVNLKPISFFDDDNERIDADINDFDVSQHTLMHIIEERRNRFPESLHDESSDKMATLLLNELERGLKMLERDHSYAKATYSGETGKISWMMPFHINNKLTDEPELVMIICKVDTFYEVKTILPYDDDIKDRITALSLYSNLW